MCKYLALSVAKVITAAIFFIGATDVSVYAASGDGWSLEDGVVTITTADGMSGWNDFYKEHSPDVRENIKSVLIDKIPGLANTYIRASMFKDCINLRNFTSSTPISLFQKDAFRDSASLKILSFTSENATTTIQEGVFKNSGIEELYVSKSGDKNIKLSIGGGANGAFANSAIKKNYSKRYIYKRHRSFCLCRNQRIKDLYAFISSTRFHRHIDFCIQWGDRC